MKKILWKKILNILDEIETLEIKGPKLNEAIAQALANDAIPYHRQDLDAFIAYLYRYELIKETKYGMDLSPVATIFARADSYSRLEALAIFECFYRYEEIRKAWKDAVHQKYSIDKLFSQTDPFTLRLLIETSLIFDRQNQHWISDRYFHELCGIMEEVDRGDASLLSVILCTAYTSSIVDHQKNEVLYKNEDHALAAYHDLSIILTAIPRRGVPCEREETRKLQSFYKDTLFHEFDHACPLCGIDLPHMLIASHIKPFRDCAHIYEAVDHHNGLLLCRNHDYLFDQGYLSFSDQGSLIISQELTGKEDMTPYHLNPDFTLPKQFITPSRRLFLDYHRRNIFKGSH